MGAVLPILPGASMASCGLCWSACTRELLSQDRYKQDPRYLRIWLQYVSAPACGYHCCAQTVLNDQAAAGGHPPRPPRRVCLHAGDISMCAGRPPYALRLPMGVRIYSPCVLQKNAIGQDQALFFVAYAAFLEVQTQLRPGRGCLAGGPGQVTLQQMRVGHCRIIRASALALG